MKTTPSNDSKKMSDQKKGSADKAADKKTTKAVKKSPAKK